MSYAKPTTIMGLPAEVHDQILEAAHSEGAIAKPEGPVASAYRWALVKWAEGRNREPETQGSVADVQTSD